MGDRIVVMKDGNIHQVDTPQNLYNMPCNMFVASFIGSPQMNFINATVEKDGDAYALCFAGCRIPSTKAELADYVGKEVVVGVRPEDIHAEGTFNSSCAISVHVNMAEMMGSEIYVYFNIDDSKMIARVSSRKDIHTDDDVRLVIDTDKIHVFDKETQAAICH